MMWKFVGASEASIIYIYIYIYNNNNNNNVQLKKIVQLDPCELGQAGLDWIFFNSPQRVEFKKKKKTL